jgi:riboflavin kinase/FMN adenylyltransferase
MKVYGSIPELAEVRGPVVLAVGVFDGLHVGHRSVLRRAAELAVELGGTAVPLSFDPHPARILRPDAAPLLLTATRHKTRLLQELGFEHALILPFNRQLAATHPDEFVTLLASAARPLAAVCVGRNWCFGKGRQGNLERLAQLGRQLHFQEIGVPEIEVDGEPVSSTRIRTSVAEGDLAGATRLLGRQYSVVGDVVPGRQMGRTIGFPTANLQLSNVQLPPNGVYAVRVRGIAGQAPGAARAAVANLGSRPTLDPLATDICLEVHILDFSGDLYGAELQVEFVDFLRPEQRFASVALLKNQIATDARHARAILIGADEAPRL